MRPPQLESLGRSRLKKESPGQRVTVSSTTAPFKRQTVPLGALKTSLTPVGSCHQPSTVRAKSTLFGSFDGPRTDVTWEGINTDIVFIDTIHRPSDFKTDAENKSALVIR
ncbi:hypothetical protein LSAT2_011286 [Lamellibrachia satsuma]|nr:hypothetical protein LSAT2_011286 [Lamellibrachia satsuma]